MSTIYILISRLQVLAYSWWWSSSSSPSLLGCWLHHQHIHAGLMVGFMAGGGGGALFGNCPLNHTLLLLGNHSRSSNSDRLQEFTPCKGWIKRKICCTNVEFGWKQIIQGGLNFLEAPNKLIGVSRQMTEDCRCSMGITCTCASCIRMDREDVGRSDFLELTAFVVLTRGGINKNCKRCKSNGITCKPSCWLFGVDQIFDQQSPGKEWTRNCWYCMVIERNLAFWIYNWWGRKHQEFMRLNVIRKVNHV